MHKNMHYKKIIIDIFAVTFREEGVDWNAEQYQMKIFRTIRHLPRGRCGLKSLRRTSYRRFPASPSARKVWIEIVLPCCDREGIMSPSARKVWIEMCSVRTFTRYASASPSARKVWIEIGLINCGVCGATSHLPRGRCGLKYAINDRLCSSSHVTFREEGVDWNWAQKKQWMQLILVTFREEGVDWNQFWCIAAWS